MTDNLMLYVWLGLTIIFAVAEAMTAQLTTVWFAAGSVTALLLAAFGVKSITVQIVVFVAVSVITLLATRPLVKKVINKKIQPTNADRYLGETGIVTEDICNLKNSGTVTIRGSVWTARSVDGTDIKAGEQVNVCKIEGVKLLVEKI